MKRHMAVALYLSAVAFVLAHTTNAFVANALYGPLEHQVISGVVTDTVIPAETSQQSVDTILHSGLFPLPLTANGVSGEAVALPPPLNVATKLSLLGTVLGKDAGVMAVLEEIPTKRQSLYRVGSQVENVGTLAVVEKNRVLLRDGTREEWLDLALPKDVPTGAPGVPPPTFIQVPTASQHRVFDRRQINAALADPARFFTQAQAVPYLRDGKLDGLRLSSVMAKGFFDTIGLRTNDILQRINGVELQDPGMVLSLFKQLQNERTLRMDLIRNSQRQTLTYEIR